MGLKTNVKSKSSQWLNGSEVGCHYESCSIQLSHFTESLKKIAFNCHQFMAAAKLLVTVASTWLTDEGKDGEDYVIMTGEDTETDD